MIDLDRLDIGNFLPHRSPFLMVDKVLSIDDNHVSTSFKIKEDNLFLEDGYFNEMGLVECAAQTCSSIVGKSYFDDEDIEGNGNKLIGFISTIKSVIITSCPKVGESVIINAKLLSRFDTEDYTICTLDCEIKDATQQYLTCQLNLFIQEVKA